MKRHSAWTQWTALAIAMAPTVAGANDGPHRVIYVAGDTESSWEEGYYRQNPQPKDQFIREADGQTLEDAWAKLANGYHLVILTHGGPGYLKLHGQRRDGFRESAGGPVGIGTGAGCGSPYPLSKKSLDNVMVEVKSCEAGNDPPGSATTVTSTVSALLNGTGNTVTGSTTQVMARFTLQYKGPTDAQRTNTKNCLDAAAQAAGFADRGAWLKSMKYPDQQTAVNNAINACRLAGQDVVNANIIYRASQAPGFALASGRRESWLGGSATSLAGPDEEDYAVTTCDGACSSSTPMPGLDHGPMGGLFAVLAAAGLVALGRRRPARARRG